MPEYTPRANLYLPGGGLSGTIPDEEADMDKLNDNFRRLDSLLGAPHVLSTERPATPVDGQLIYETDTRNVLSYSAALLKWTPVGTPNCPSIAYRDALFGALPAVGARCTRNGWTEVWTAAQPGVGAMNTAGWLREGGTPQKIFRLDGTTTNQAGGSIREYFNVEVVVDVATKCRVYSSVHLWTAGNAAGFLRKGIDDTWDSMVQLADTAPVWDASAVSRWHSNSRATYMAPTYDAGFIVPSGTHRVKMRLDFDAASTSQEVSNLHTVLSIGV